MSKEFKEKVLKAQQEGDIASLYILEAEAHEVLNDDDLQGFYANILDLALEKLTNTLEAHVQLNMNEVQDFATLRALYEYAIEHYHAGQNKDASALFEVLSGLSNDAKFSKAMKMHQFAADEGLNIDNFLDKIADIDSTQKMGTFYISEFQKEAQKLLDNA